MELPPDITASDRVMFEVDGEVLTDLPDVQRFWASTAPSLRRKAVPALTAELVIE
jgi:hypothetical protein